MTKLKTRAYISLAFGIAWTLAFIVATGGAYDDTGVLLIPLEPMMRTIWFLSKHTNLLVAYTAGFTVNVLIYGLPVFCVLPLLSEEISRANPKV